MTASLTTIISKVQALLLDDGTRYTTATVTAAVRQALKEYNDAAPVLAGTLVTVVADQKEYELYGGDFATIRQVTGVWLNDADGEDDIELEHITYAEDNRVYIRLTEAQTSGDLLVRYTQGNTINGLDSETMSTIQDRFDQVIVDGGAFYSISIRSTGRVETINLNKDVPDNLREAAARLLGAFEIGKRLASDAARPRPARLDTTWDFNPTGF